MWKWTDENNIKGIILDADSLKHEYLDFDYESVINDVRVYKVSNGSNKLGIKDYYDIFGLLVSIINESSISSSSLIAISSNVLFLKEMIQNHIGTILVGNYEGNLENLTDFRCNSIRTIKNILSNKTMDFLAEFIAYNQGSIDKSKKYLLNLATPLIGDSKRRCRYIYGGRYYPNSKSFLKDDPLSVVVKNFKSRYEKVVDTYFDSVLSWLNKNEEIDVLTYVPLKPDEIKDKRFDRFSSLKLPNLKKEGILLENIIECTKNYTQKEYDYKQRLQNVKGAYRVINDVKNKHVVLIDDVRTTGATTEEIANILYDEGAKFVTVVLLSVNQTITSSKRYESIKCEKCGNEMRLKINKDHKLFFGCSQYYLTKCNFTLKYEVGMKKIKELNQLNVVDISDIDDIY